MKRSVAVLIAVGVLVIAGAGYWLLSDRLSSLFPLPVNKPLDRTATCKTRVPPPFQFLTLAQLQSLNQGSAVGKTYPVSNAPCIRLGELNVSFVLHSDPPNVLGTLPTGGLKVTEIRIIAPTNLPPFFTEITPYRDLDELEAFLGKYYGKDPDRKYYLLRVEATKKLAVVHDRSLPERSTLGSTVNWSEAEELLKQGATLVDVRPEEEFAKSQNESARNIPYVLGRPDDRNFKEPVAAYRARDRFDLQQLPPGKFSVLIFMGRDVFDFTPLRAMNLAQLGGWKRLFWYREGELGRTGVPLATPISWTDIKTVTPDEARKLLVSGANFVDTRSREDVENAKIRIPGANRAPFLGSDGPATLLTLSPGAIREKGESLDFSKLRPDKNAELVVFGEDVYDWAALKAAILAKEAGWTQISWMREGIAGWLSAQDQDSNLYLTEKAK